jgi:hypothetical protein
MSGSIGPAEAQAKWSLMIEEATGRYRDALKSSIDERIAIARAEAEVKYAVVSRDYLASFYIAAANYFTRERTASLSEHGERLLALTPTSYLRVFSRICGWF